MTIRKVKKYFGLCQCKGCLNKFETVATVLVNNSWYHAYLCEECATVAILDPLWRYNNANP